MNQDPQSLPDPAPKPIPVKIVKRKNSVVQMHLTNRQLREAMQVWVNRAFMHNPTLTQVKILKPKAKRRFILTLKMP